MSEQLQAPNRTEIMRQLATVWSKSASPTAHAASTALLRSLSSRPEA
ncbi:MAG: hypothetical protein ACOYD0_12545 [Candidatus Nanopelagicales bacterium]